MFIISVKYGSFQNGSSDGSIIHKPSSDSYVTKGYV